MVQASATITIECEYIVTCSLSYGVISTDLEAEWPLNLGYN